ncbi:MAG: TVP38/TMEM64 family protein [Bilifractor sp.]|jgi:uncharacterized membrane protein YdjX (TVP38/TMEM64 family)
MRRKLTVAHNKNRTKGILITAAMAALVILLVVHVTYPMLGFVTDVEGFRNYAAEAGPAALLRFYGMMILQTLSVVIPAGPFEIAAGAAFGIGIGTLICDVAITTGNMAAFLLSRKYGMKYVTLFVDKEKIDQKNWAHMTPKKKFLAAMFYLIPGLPKDQLTYILGMSDLPAREFLFICSILRLPTILVQVISGDELVHGHMGTSIFLIVIMSVITCAGAIFYGRREKKKDQES